MALFYMFESLFSWRSKGRNAIRVKCASFSNLRYTTREESHRLRRWLLCFVPFADVMNLLANNEEFRKLVGEFAERMKEILGIEVKWVATLPIQTMYRAGEADYIFGVIHLISAGQMPSMSDMMRCAQDPQLRDLSVKWVQLGKKLCCLTVRSTDVPISITAYAKQTHEDLTRWWNQSFTGDTQAFVEWDARERTVMIHCCNAIVYA